MHDILLRYTAALAELLRTTDAAAADRDTRIAEGFQDIWESAFTAMRALEGLEPLADLLEAQSRVHGQIRAELERQAGQMAEAGTLPRLQ